MSPSRKRHRSSNYDDVEQALFQWFRKARAPHLTVSGPILLAKGLDLAEKNSDRASFHLVDGSTGLRRDMGLFQRACVGENGIVDYYIGWDVN